MNLNTYREQYFRSTGKLIFLGIFLLLLAIELSLLLPRSVSYVFEILLSFIFDTLSPFLLPILFVYIIMFIFQSNVILYNLNLFQSKSTGMSMNYFWFLHIIRFIPVFSDLYRCFYYIKLNDAVSDKKVKKVNNYILSFLFVFAFVCFFFVSVFFVYSKMSRRDGLSVAVIIMGMLLFTSS